MGIVELDPPMHRAMELAWESFCAGSLGVGAVITRNDDIVATGRNRLAEAEPGDDVLAGTSLAHAELNALAKLQWGGHADGLQLWTTLQPCLQCLGAIRLSVVAEVHVLAPDPLFRGVEAARHLNRFIGSSWPDFVQTEVNEWAVLSLLLVTHVATLWKAVFPGWNESLPSIAALAGDLVERGELLGCAEDRADVREVAESLWPRLGRCVPEVVELSRDGL
jgi:tRNA(Arg) A34 adenosine deaminase TadA